MTDVLLPCPSCRRYVFEDAKVCPFCKESLLETNTDAASLTLAAAGLLLSGCQDVLPSAHATTPPNTRDAGQASAPRDAGAPRTTRDAGTSVRRDAGVRRPRPRVPPPEIGLDYGVSPMDSMHKDDPENPSD